MLLLLVALLVCSFALNSAYLHGHHFHLPSRLAHSLQMSRGGNKIAPNVKPTVVKIDLGDGYAPVSLDFFPLFESSSFFTVTYAVPFGLNIEKPPPGFPAPVVNKDSGKAGGEKVGDVLRATSCWSQGFDAAGATSDIFSFAGQIKWKKSVFDVTGAPWDETIKALVSNTAERSKSVTLVFERESLDNESDKE